MARKNRPTPIKPEPCVPQMSRPERGSDKINPRYFLFLLMIVVFFGCFVVIRPYIHIILLALIFSFVVSPIHIRLETLLGKRQNLAAFVSCVLLTVVVVIPLLFMVFSLIQQGVLTFNAMSEWIAQEKYRVVLAHPMVIRLSTWAGHILPDVRKIYPGLDLASIQIDKLVMDTSANMGKTLLSQGGRIAADIGSLIVKFCLFIFTFFFMVRDEATIVNRLLHLIPMNRSQEEQIIDKIKGIAKSALLGTFVTSVSQGVAGGLAFYICGLPGLFWGMIMTFASLIPMVGTSLVWVPAVLYLLVSGHVWLALFMLIWCMIVVGGIDSFVRPLFMKGGSDMNTMMIFFSILGGINSFGLLGLLYGPLLFGLALVLLYIYNIEFTDFLKKQDQC